MKSGAAPYELVFQGIERNEPQAFKRIREALQGELQLSIEEVQQVLEGSRYVVKRAKSETN